MGRVTVDAGEHPLARQSTEGERGLPQRDLVPRDSPVHPDPTARPSVAVVEAARERDKSSPVTGDPLRLTPGEAKRHRRQHGDECERRHRVPGRITHVFIVAEPPPGGRA